MPACTWTFADRRARCAGVLAHLPARHILLNESEPAPGDAPPTATEAVSHLHAQQITLIYEPETRTLRSDTTQEVKITIDPHAEPQNR